MRNMFKLANIQFLRQFAQPALAFNNPPCKAMLSQHRLDKNEGGGHQILHKQIKYHNLITIDTFSRSTLLSLVTMQL